MHYTQYAYTGCCLSCLAAPGPDIVTPYWENSCSVSLSPLGRKRALWALMRIEKVLEGGWVGVLQFFKRVAHTSFFRLCGSLPRGTDLYNYNTHICRDVRGVDNIHKYHAEQKTNAFCFFSKPKFRQIAASLFCRFHSKKKRCVNCKTFPDKTRST